MLARLMDRPFSTRLAVAYALFLLPIAFLLFNNWSDVARQVGVAQSEIAGTRLVHDLSRLQQQVLSGDVAVPEVSTRPEVRAARAAYDATRRGGHAP